MLLQMGANFRVQCCGVGLGRIGLRSVSMPSPPPAPPRVRSTTIPALAPLADASAAVTNVPSALPQKQTKAGQTALQLAKENTDVSRLLKEAPSKYPNHASNDKEVRARQSPSNVAWNRTTLSGTAQLPRSHQSLLAP